VAALSNKLTQASTDKQTSKQAPTCNDDKGNDAGAGEAKVEYEVEKEVEVENVLYARLRQLVKLQSAKQRYLSQLESTKVTN
jgi:hypothetical protein